MASVWMKLAGTVGLPRMLRLLRWYPPYLGAGVRVTHVSEDLRTLSVEMRLTSFNRNYVGTHFGGSLYSMVDPFFMLILLQHLGEGFIVWDKSATIDFLRPGRGRVRATFHIPGEQIEEIRQRALRERKTEPVFEVEIRDDQDEVVARVRKVLYVRSKLASRQQQAGGVG